MISPRFVEPSVYMSQLRKYMIVKLTQLFVWRFDNREALIFGIEQGNAHNTRTTQLHNAMPVKAS